MDKATGHRTDLVVLLVERKFKIDQGHVTIQPPIANGNKCDVVGPTAETRDCKLKECPSKMKGSL